MAVEKAAFELPFGDFGRIARAKVVSFEQTLDQFNRTFASTPKQSIRRKLKENIAKIEVCIKDFDHDCDGEKKA